MRGDIMFLRGLDSFTKFRSQIYASASLTFCRLWIFLHLRLRLAFPSHYLHRKASAAYLVSTATNRVPSIWHRLGIHDLQLAMLLLPGRTSSLQRPAPFLLVLSTHWHRKLQDRCMGLRPRDPRHSTCIASPDGPPSYPPFKRSVAIILLSEFCTRGFFRG